MSKNLKLIKVSDLPEATSIDNLLTLGVDSNHNSVKVPIELLKGNKGDTGESGGNLTNKSIYNITQTTGSTYSDKQTARNAVVSNLRASGQIIAYKLTAGWVNEQYIGADVNGWAIESNWKEIGTKGTLTITNETDTVPSNYAVNTLQKRLYSEGSGDETQIIPYATNTAILSTQANTLVYITQDLLRDKYITRIKLDVKTIGSLSIFKLTNPNTTSSTCTLLAKVNIPAIGVQEINLSEYAIKLEAGEYIGFRDLGDGATWSYSTAAKNTVGGGFYFLEGSAWSTNANRLNWNVNIGIWTSDTLTEEIGDIPRLDERIDHVSNNLKGKKFSIMGDSISTFTGYVPSGNNPFYPSGTLTSVDQTWWKRLINDNGMILEINESWGGARITNTIAASSFTNSARYSRLSNPDIILNLGGINDLTSTVTPKPLLGEFNLTDTTRNLAVVKQAYQFLIEEQKSLYPSADIFLIVPAESNRIRVDEKNTQGWSYLDLRDAIKRLSEIYNVGFIDLLQCGITYDNAATYLLDGLHPNALGMQLIKEYIAKQLINHYGINALTKGDVVNRLGDSPTSPIAQEIVTKTFASKADKADLIHIVQDGETIADNGKYLMLDDGTIRLGDITLTETIPSSVLVRLNVALNKTGTSSSNSLYSSSHSFDLPIGAVSIEYQSFTTSSANTPIQFFDANSIFIGDAPNAAGDDSALGKITTVNIPIAARKITVCKHTSTNPFTMTISKGSTISNSNQLLLLKIGNDSVKRIILRELASKNASALIGDKPITEGRSELVKNGDYIAYSSNNEVVSKTVPTISGYWSITGIMTSSGYYTHAEKEAIPTGYNVIEYSSYTSTSAIPPVVFLDADNIVVGFGRNGSETAVTGVLYGEKIRMKIPDTATQILRNKSTAATSYTFNLYKDAAIINNNDCIQLIEKTATSTAITALRSLPQARIADQIRTVLVPLFDFGSKYFRIPFCTLTKKNSIIVGSEIRYDSNADTGRIDIGIKRSTDGGLTFDKGTTVLVNKGLVTNSRKANGVITVDEITGRIYLFAHSVDNDEGWESIATDGWYHDYADMVYKYSDDDGVTWSEEYSFKTRQPGIFPPNLVSLFPATGAGITMQDGTIVIPCQAKRSTMYSGNDIDPSKIFNIQACFVYLTPQNKASQTWQVSSMVPTYSSENMIVEYEKGKLMINARGYTGTTGRRRVFTTNNMGATWTVHASDKTIVEPSIHGGCQGTFIKTTNDHNQFVTNYGLFLNPQDPATRKQVTLQASADYTNWHVVQNIIPDIEVDGYTCLASRNDLLIMVAERKGWVDLHIISSLKRVLGHKVFE